MNHPHTQTMESTWSQSGGCWPYIWGRSGGCWPYTRGQSVVVDHIPEVSQVVVDHIPEVSQVVVGHISDLSTWSLLWDVGAVNSISTKGAGLPSIRAMWHYCLPDKSW